MPAQRADMGLTVLKADLAFFEEHATRWPGEQVALRLVALADAISKEACRLLAEHGRGCVAVLTGETGIGFIRWEAEREILADKEYYRARGTTVFFVDEMLGQIKDLVMELANGNWVPAVTWLNNHAIYSEKGERPL